jgi:hypothetical protein
MKMETGRARQTVGPQTADVVTGLCACVLSGLERLRMRACAR